MENSSSLGGQVKFYATNVGGVANAPGSAALSTQLLVKVEFAVGSFLGCTAFPASPTNVFGGSSGGLLSAMPSSYSTAAGSIWAPAAGGADDFGTYKITWSSPNNSSNNAVQGGTALVDFNWEIQTT